MSSASGRVPTYLVWILAGATAAVGAGAVVVIRQKKIDAAEEEARRKAADSLGEARAFFKKGDYKECIDKLEEALELDPELTEASQLLDRAKEQLAVQAEAEKRQEKEREKRAKKREQELREHEYQLKTARKMLDLDQLDEALDAVRKALDLVPGSPEAIQLLERIEKDKAKLANEREDGKRRRELKAERRRHERERARMTHDLALKTARMMFERGAYQGAKELVDDALKQVPDSPEAKKLLEEVEAKLREDRLEKREAKEEERLARERARIHHDVSLAAAEEALEEKAFKLARKYVDEALEADPESEEAKALRKRIDKAERAEKKRLAKLKFDKALKRAAHDSAIETGRQFLKAGNFEAAKKLALKALQELPESVEARKLYDEASAGEKKAALDSEAEKRRQHDAAIAQARTGLAAGRLDAARTHAGRALELIPGSAEARQVLKEIAATKAAAARKPKEPRGERLLEISRAFFDRSLLDGSAYFARKALMEDPQSGPALAMLQQISSARFKVEHERLRHERERERKASEAQLEEMIRKMEEERKEAEKKRDESRQRSEEERRRAQEDLRRKTDDLKDLREDLQRLIRETRQREVAPVAVFHVGAPGVGVGAGADKVATLVAKGYERLGRNELDGAEAAGKAALELRPGYGPAETLLEDVRKRRAEAVSPVVAVERTPAPPRRPSGEILARLDRALQDEDIDALSTVLGETLAAREVANAMEFFSLASEIKIERKGVEPAPGVLKSDWTITYLLEGKPVSCALRTEYTVRRMGDEDRIVAVKDLK